MEGSIWLFVSIKPIYWPLRFMSTKITEKYVRQCMCLHMKMNGLGWIFYWIPQPEIISQYSNQNNGEEIIFRGLLLDYGIVSCLKRQSPFNNRCINHKGTHLLEQTLTMSVVQNQIFHLCDSVVRSEPCLSKLSCKCKDSLILQDRMRVAGLHPQLLYWNITPLKSIDIHNFISVEDLICQLDIFFFYVGDFYYYNY